MTIVHSQCRICGNTNLVEVLNLGNQILSCVFPAEAEDDPSQSPLLLVKCHSDGTQDACGLVQLKHTAELSEMYGTTYGYHSSLSPSMVIHLEAIARRVVSVTKPQNNDYILDIGCNDGTLLNAYRQFGDFKRLGIDPSSKKFRQHFQTDIHVSFEFFSSNVALAALGNNKCKIVTSIAMFYDLDDPRSFIHGVAEILHSEGIWALELSYLPMLLSQLTYDQICHEHVAYYGLRELQNLFDEAGLKVVDLSFNDMNGGSIFLLVGHKSSQFTVNQLAIEAALRQESQLNCLQPYKRYARRLAQHKDDVLQFFARCRSSGIWLWCVYQRQCSFEFLRNHEGDASGYRRPQFGETWALHSWYSHSNFFT
jgi:NDP-4-keto-2,6-dideoxyhexose 3-C-methyltransferase